MKYSEEWGGVNMEIHIYFRTNQMQIKALNKYK